MAKKKEGGAFSSARVKWFITFLLPICLVLIPEGEVYTNSVKFFSVVTLFGILMTAFELTDLLIPSLILPLGYVLFKVAEPAVIFSPWASSTPWMFLGMFLFAIVLQGIGLINRVALWCVAHIGGGFKGLAFAVLITGFILSLILPGGNAHNPLLFFVYGICVASGWKNTKESALLMMFVTLGTYSATKFILNPYILMMADMVGYEGKMTFFSFLFQNIVFLPWLLLVAFMMFKVLKPEGKMQSREYYMEQYKALGPLSKDEKKGTIIALIAIIMILTLDIHKIEMGWCFVIIACLLYMPGIAIGTSEDVKNIYYNIPFFVAACMSIGSVGTAIGVGQIVSDAIIPFMADVNETEFYLLILLVGILMNFAMSPLGVVAVITVPLIELSRMLGFSDFATLNTIYFGVNQLIFPYEYIAYLFMFSFGMMKMKDFMKVYGIKMIMSFVYLALIILPWYRLIGVL